MNPQEYIQQKLIELKEFQPKQISDKKELQAEIFRLLMSKKFRKYSVTPDYQEHIKQSIEFNVNNNAPIKLTFPFGGYKLWRLEESPEVDWAEFFTIIYYTKWLKPICEIYKPGVTFIFYSDDIIVSRLDNINPEDTQAYRQSFQKLIDFIESYLPENLQFIYKRVIDQYKDGAEFEEDLASRIELLTNNPNQLPAITETSQAMMDLNVKLTEKEKNDPKWREKNHLLHHAYLGVKYKRPFYRKEDNILIFTTPIKDSIAVGTTKRSIAKYWCGIGVLKKDNDTFNQFILSPKQIEDSNLIKQPLNLQGLEGKNFQTIKIK
jgi:hypothetical protein